MQLRIEIHSRQAATLRKMLETFAPRIAFTEKVGWFFATFTAEGEELYIKRLSAAVDAWQADEDASNAW